MYARTTISLGTALTVLAFATPETASAQQPRGEVMQAGLPHPLAQTWILNVEQSDNAREEMEQAARQAQRARPDNARNRGDRSRVGGRRGGRGGGGRGATRLSPQAQATNRVAQQRMMRPGVVMNIIITDSTATIGHDNMLPWVFSTDESKRDFQDGVEVSGQWDGDKLLVETRTDGGLRIRETYELKDDGQKLEVSYVLENNRMNQRVRFKRVYNPQGTTG